MVYYANSINTGGIKLHGIHNDMLKINFGCILGTSEEVKVLVLKNWRWGLKYQRLIASYHCPK